MPSTAQGCAHRAGLGDAQVSSSPLLHCSPAAVPGGEKILNEAFRSPALWPRVCRLSFGFFIAVELCIRSKRTSDFPAPEPRICLPSPRTNPQIPLAPGRSPGGSFPPCPSESRGRALPLPDTALPVPLVPSPVPPLLTHSGEPSCSGKWLVGLRASREDSWTGQARLGSLPSPLGCCRDRAQPAVPMGQHSMNWLMAGLAAPRRALLVMYPQWGLSQPGRDIPGASTPPGQADSSG